MPAKDGAKRYDDYEVHVGPQWREATTVRPQPDTKPSRSQRAPAPFGRARPELNC